MKSTPANRLGYSNATEAPSAPHLVPVDTPVFARLVDRMAGIASVQDQLLKRIDAALDRLGASTPISDDCRPVRDCADGPSVYAKMLTEINRMDDNLQYLECLEARLCEMA